LADSGELELLDIWTSCDQKEETQVGLPDNSPALKAARAEATSSAWRRSRSLSQRSD